MIGRWFFTRFWPMYCRDDVWNTQEVLLEDALPLAQVVHDDLDLERDLVRRSARDSRPHVERETHVLRADLVDLVDDVAVHGVVADAGRFEDRDLFPDVEDADAIVERQDLRARLHGRVAFPHERVERREEAPRRSMLVEDQAESLLRNVGTSRGSPQIVGSPG
jgi:hypothetical protein